MELFFYIARKFVLQYNFPLLGFIVGRILAQCFLQWNCKTKQRETERIIWESFKLGGPEKHMGAHDTRHAVQENGGLADFWSFLFSNA